MSKPNNPYARPINATNPKAMLQLDYDGTPVANKVLSNKAGANNASPASRYFTGVPYQPPTPPKDPKPRKSKPVSTVDTAAITEDDLFG